MISRILSNRSLPRDIAFPLFALVVNLKPDINSYSNQLGSQLAICYIDYSRPYYFHRRVHEQNKHKKVKTMHKIAPLRITFLFNLLQTFTGESS